MTFDSTSSNNKHPIELLRNSRLYPRHEWRGFTRYRIMRAFKKPTEIPEWLDRLNRLAYCMPAGHLTE